MDRFDSMCARYLDGTATVEETADLAQLLHSDTTRARAFLDLYELDRLLSVLHAPTRADAIEAVLAQVRNEADPFVESVAREIARSPSGAPSIESLTNRVATWLAGRSSFRRWSMASALAIALVTGLILWMIGPAMGDPVLADVQGAAATIERGTARIPAARGMPLQRGDTLRTGTNATLSLAFGKEATWLTLGGNGELKINSFRSRKQFHLRHGLLNAEVMRQRPFAPLVITTPNASATVVGTRFTLAARTNATQLDVEEGRVRLSDTTGADGRSVTVPAGWYSIVAPETELSVLPRTGSILLEIWTNLPGSDVQLDFQRHSERLGQPARREWMKLLNTPRSPELHYGARWRGFLHPPISGDYRFAFAAAGNAILYISEDEQPEHKMHRLSASTRLALLPELTLRAGRHYYIEVLHKVGNGAGHMSLTWNRPDGKHEIISGEHLSPFEPEPKP